MIGSENDKNNAGNVKGYCGVKKAKRKYGLL